jgi:hypothetical protein
LVPFFNATLDDPADLAVPYLGLWEDMVASYGLRVTGCVLRVTGYGLRVTGYGLRVARYGLRVALLRVTGCALRVARYGLRVASYGLRVASLYKNGNHPFCTPQPATRNP